MSLRPPPRRTSQPPTPPGADPRATLETAVAAAETVLAGTVPRLAELTRVADQTRFELEALLGALRNALSSLHGAAPLVAPPPRIVPPPLPAAALDAEEVEPIEEAVEEPAPRKTSPLEETAEMPQLTLREDQGDDDEIRFVCEKCGKKLSAPKRFVGKKAGCKCGVKTTVPEKSTREKKGKP
jgi:uncharacterized coiled-coil protein SlyX